MLHKSQKNKLKFIMLVTESNINMLWPREEFVRICGQDLVEKAQEIEVTIPVKTAVQPQSRFRVLSQKSFLEQVTGWCHNQQLQYIFIYSNHECPINGRCVLLCFIVPSVRKTRSEASSCPGIFSRTLRF